MKLYYAPGTCALACWIALEWAGADYEVEKVKLGSPEYLKINPLGAVPALDVPDYRIITQASAILQYIADLYSASDLGADSGVTAQSEFNELIGFLTGDFHPAFWPVFTPNRYTVSKSAAALDEAVQAGYIRVDRAMTYLDSLIGNTNHVYKNKRTVLDPYAYVMARWSVKTPKPWTEYPNLARFMRQMDQDPAVQKVKDLSK
ncbi:TPA: glutathione S-transferase family protein [Streptococcus suis]